MIKELMILGSWAAITAGVSLEFGLSWALVTGGAIGLFIAWNVR